MNKTTLKDQLKAFAIIIGVIFAAYIIGGVAATIGTGRNGIIWLSALCLAILAAALIWQRRQDRKDKTETGNGIPAEQTSTTRNR